MAEEIKNVLCGGCGEHCLVKVRVDAGKVMKQFYPKPNGSPLGEDAYRIVNACPRARSVTEYIDHPERLNYPLKRAGERGENKWKRVTWEEALDGIAAKLVEVRDRFGPEAAYFCHVGENNTSEEYRFRFQYLFGSPLAGNYGQI